MLNHSSTQYMTLSTGCDECAGNNEEDGPDHSQFSLVRVCITTVITFILILSTMASFNAIINTQTIHGEQMIGVSDLVFLLLSIVSHCATFAILAIFRGGEDSQNKAHTRACLVRYYCNLSTLIFLLSLLNTKWYWERSSDLQTQGFEEYFYRCRIASTWQIGIFGMITLLLWIRYRTLYDPEQVCLSLSGNFSKYQDFLT